MLAIIVSVILTFFAAMAEAQAPKVIPWAEFWQGVDFVRMPSGQWEFVYGGQVVNNNISVKIPAGTLSMKFIYQFGLEEGEPGYQAILDRNPGIRFQGREVTIKLIYKCRQVEEGCKQIMSSLISGSFIAKSRGVSNYDYKGELLPENLIFSFLVSQAARE